MLMGRFSPAELMICLAVALLLFGPGRLADMGKGLGEGIKNLKKGLQEAALDDNAKEDEKNKKPGETKKVEEKSEKT